MTRDKKRVSDVNKVARFIKGFAKKEGFKVEDSLYGEIVVGKNPFLRQNAGAVYGIWIEVPEEEKFTGEVFEDLRGIFSKSGKTIKYVEPIEYEGYWYCLYWGKALSPSSRILAHLIPSKSTGGLKLNEKPELARYREIFGALYTEKYYELEKALHDKYPPLVGSDNSGRISIYTKIFRQVRNEQ